MGKIMLSVPELADSWWPVYHVVGLENPEPDPMHSKGGGATAKMSFSSIAIVRPYDRLSPRLAIALNSGKNVSTMELRFWKDPNVPWVKWIFGLSRVEELAPYVPFSIGVPLPPSEKITFVYSSLKFEYFDKTETSTWPSAL